MSDWGLKVALPGVDVATATPDQCALHSSYASPKIKKNQSPPHRGLVQIIFNSTLAAGDTTVYSFAHTYTYTPKMWAVMQRTDASNNIFGFQPFINGTFSVKAQVNGTNFAIIANSPGGILIQQTINCSYAIFAESGA